MVGKIALKSMICPWCKSEIDLQEKGQQYNMKTYAWVFCFDCGRIASKEV